MSNHYKNTDSRWAIALRSDFRCVWCGLADLRFEANRGEADEAQIDHLHCQSRGLNNRATNLLLSCGPCNMSRQDTDWIEWAGVVCERTGEAVEAIVARVRSHRRRQLCRPAGRLARRAYATTGHAGARAVATRLGLGHYIEG